MSDEKHEPWIKETELSAKTKAAITIGSVVLGFLLAWAYRKENADNPTAIKVKGCVSAIIGILLIMAVIGAIGMVVQAIFPNLWKTEYEIKEQEKWKRIEQYKKDHPMPVSY